MFHLCYRFLPRSQRERAGEHQANADEVYGFHNRPHGTINFSICDWVVLPMAAVTVRV